MALEVHKNNGRGTEYKHFHDNQDNIAHYGNFFADVYYFSHNAYGCDRKTALAAEKTEVSRARACNDDVDSAQVYPDAYRRNGQNYFRTEGKRSGDRLRKL